MSALRLGAYQLPAAEVVLVQTLFRLFAHGDTFRWAFVTAPPYDALLVDASGADHRSAGALPEAKAVLRLTRMHAPDAPNTLQRPIRADRLREWLHRTELDLLDTHVLPQPVDTLIEQAESLAIETERALQTSALRFKLRRWPPAVVLRGDPTRIRMATLLSRRALSSAELAGISGAPIDECQSFMQLLQTTGLVALHQDAPAPVSQPTPAAHSSDTPPPHQRTFGRGLIAGIRRRLGALTGGAHAS